MIRLAILTLSFTFSSLAHAQFMGNCWMFPRFSDGDTQVHALKLNILPASSSKRPIHVGELTITTTTVDAKGRRKLQEQPTGNLTCVPLKDGRKAMNCYGEDDRGKIIFSVTDHEASIELNYLNTIVVDESTRKTTGVELVAPDGDPIVVKTKRRCKRNLNTI